MHVEPGLRSPARAVGNVFDLESLHEAVERLLVGRFDAEKNEAESGLAHERIVRRAEAPETHVAVDADAAVQSARDHPVAEFLQPLSGGERAGIVHDLFHAVARNKLFDFVQHAFDAADAVLRIERRPAAERAFRVPAVAGRHYVRSGAPLEIAVLLRVEPPRHEIAVDARGGIEIVVEAEASGVPHLAVFAVPYARLVLRRIEARADDPREKKIPIAACENQIDG